VLSSKRGKEGETAFFDSQIDGLIPRPKKIGLPDFFLKK
jgi:hypothetical protein